MEKHPIESVMETTMEQLKQMIDVNTIVGEPVETQLGTIIIPISKVSFGFVSGGGQYGENKCSKKNEEEIHELPFAGGSGAGVSLNPMAFLVVSEDAVNMIPASFNNSYDRIIEMVPKLLCDIKNMVVKGKKNKENKGTNDSNEKCGCSCNEPVEEVKTTTTTIYQ